MKCETSTGCAGQALSPADIWRDLGASQEVHLCSRLADWRSAILDAKASMCSHIE